MTFAVMYGCTSTSRSWAKLYLKAIRDQGDVSHPMLLPVLFVELERKRLLNLLDRHQTNLRQRILSMESKLHTRQRSNEDTEDSGIDADKRDCDLTKLWTAVSSLKNGLEGLKFQLSDMIEHSATLSEAPAAVLLRRCAQQNNTESKINARLCRIIAELDSKIRCTETVLGGMSLATQMVGRVSA